MRSRRSPQYGTHWGLFPPLRTLIVYVCVCVCGPRDAPCSFDVVILHKGRWGDTTAPRLAYRYGVHCLFVGSPTTGNGVEDESEDDDDSV